MAKFDKLLAEQLDYYRARAREYDDSVRQTSMPDVDREWHHIVSTLQALPPVDTALELACGTGLWTRPLLSIAKRVVAIDGAEEMLQVNKDKIGSDRVVYYQADLFNWQPSESYPLVFFAFWLSHVPSELVPNHLAQVAKAVEPGGRLFIVDEPRAGQQLSGPSEGGEQNRTLFDGSEYRIVKIYLDPEAVAEQLRGLGFSDVHVWHGDFYFYINAVK